MQSADIICRDCGKKCKSKGGYKRHMAAKHGQDENRVNCDESNTNADKTRKNENLGDQNIFFRLRGDLNFES